MKAPHIAVISVFATVAIVLSLSKIVSTNATTLNGSVVVPSFIDIAIAYNHGISFGLFAQDTALGSRLLVLVTTLLIAALSIWAYKTSRPTIGAALGIIIGGALVNTFDRAFNGTVFDYLYFHLGSVALFVCNAPDIAISLGFIILVLDELFSSNHQPASKRNLED